MILRVAPEGTKVTMAHRDGSTREVETRGFRLHNQIAIWWPLCGPYVVNLHTGVMSDELWGDTGAAAHALALWRMRADDLRGVREAYNPGHTHWPEIDPWPPTK